MEDVYCGICEIGVLGFHKFCVYRSPSFDDESTATGGQEVDTSVVQIELQSDDGR